MRRPACLLLAAAWALQVGGATPARAAEAKAAPLALPENPFPAAAAGAVDAKALEALLARARATSTDAVVVLRDGKLVGEWTFGKPRSAIPTMSVTKSVVSLAVGRLVETGRLKSLDEPVATFYPEWRQGRKRAVTVRHLLNHTSGLQAERTTKNEIDPSPDHVQLALAAELTSDPGAAFFYNNKAVALLSGIVGKASGKPLDRLVAEEIFAPLGITDFSWWHDAAGTPAVSAGLSLHALDLAKIGQMLLDGGTWKGRPVVSKDWIAQSTSPGQPFTPSCGLLWWLDYPAFKLTIDDRCVDAWRQAGLEADFLAKVLPMKGRLFTRQEFFAELEARLGGKAGVERWHDHTWRRGLPDGVQVPDGPLSAFRADGWLGQVLLVVPKARLVAVRQMRAPDWEKTDESKLDAMKDFVSLANALVP